MPTISATNNPLRERLILRRNTDGGWGYRARGASAAEPTAWACAALLGGNVTDQAEANRGLAWLASIQKPNGAVPIGAEHDGPDWCTPLALIAWSLAARRDADRFADSRRRATDFLLTSGGEPVESNPKVFGHDTSLVGWSWVSGTHSWVEPTSIAVLALKMAGERDQRRTREGVRLLVDRVLPDGGWNYGNTRLFGRVLRPFPETTGLALAALADEEDCGAIERSVDWLTRQLPRIRAPLSVAWGAIALTRLGRRGPDVDEWVSRGVDTALKNDAFTTHDALLMIASRSESFAGRRDTRRSDSVRSRSAIVGTGQASTNEWQGEG